MSAATQRFIAGLPPEVVCKRKRRYPTKAIAKQEAKRVHREGGLEIDIYPCDYCGGWHLTKRRGRTSNARFDKYGFVHGKKPDPHSSTT